MKAQIFSHEKPIGTTELYLGDESMGCLYGNFIPNENYFRFVQKTVWAFWSKAKPDYEKWHAMKFNIQLDNGYFIYAAGGITIEDIEDAQQESKRIDIAGIHRHVIEDFFLETQPRPFTEEPWESISIEQKIGFENELAKELGIHNKNSFFKIFNGTKSKHVLTDFELSALCHDSRSDDVLFIAGARSHDKQFAVVHLTWRGAKEIDTYPHVEFYDSFDDFKYNRMYPDKADWEY